MRRFSWIKDSLIQIVFISFAVVFTVTIAKNSISEQYTEYHKRKLEAKAEVLAHNAAVMFSDSDIKNADGISFILNVIFPAEGSGSEIIRYALFEPDGRVAKSTVNADLELPDAALYGVYTHVDDTIVQSYYPLTIDGAVRYILMIHIDNTPFLQHSRALAISLYTSLFRGCLMMAAGYALFSVISNLRKKKKPDETDDPDIDIPEEETKQPKGDGTPARLMIQIASIIICAALALPLLWLYLVSDGLFQIISLLLGGLLMSVAVAHLCRVLFWFIRWYTRRPITGYSAQTMQFLVFLLVFLSMYCYSIQNSYNTQVELSRNDELRVLSVFTGLSLSGGEEKGTGSLPGKIETMDFGENNECLIIVRSPYGFSVAGNSAADTSSANDLFFSAWEGQAAVTGVRGGYNYGVSVIVDSAFEIIALAAIRQPASVQADELRGATIDFLLAMTATVAAFVFLFIELNRLLEAVNIPNLKREPGLRYVRSTRSLMFLATACRYIPLYFFVLIILDIYKTNPLSWLPSNLATVLPIAVVLLVMAVGKDLTGRVFKMTNRKTMLVGCFVGAFGFLSLYIANNIPSFLILLVFTYTGISMVYNGLWELTSKTVDTGYPEFRDMREHTLSGEYLGGTAGAVIGAMVYNRYGLFAAFALSAAVLLILSILIRTLLPVGSITEKAEKREYGFFRFLFSGRIILYMSLLLMPFVLGEYFIEQFSPLYASSIALSPGAASWTSLLMAIALAYVGPGIVGLFAGRIHNVVICVIANLLSAAGLVLFAVIPGIVTMYIASALIGLSIGVGKNIISLRYSELIETKKYAHSGYAYNLFDSLFGMMGAALFTVAHAFSLNEEYILVIAGLVIVPTLLYLIVSKRRKVEVEE